jgi:hypothetical protein
MFNRREKRQEASTRKWSHCVRFILPPRLPQKVSKLESILQRGSGPQRYFRLWDQERGGGGEERASKERKRRDRAFLRANYLPLLLS